MEQPTKRPPSESLDCFLSPQDLLRVCFVRLRDRRAAYLGEDGAFHWASEDDPRLADPNPEVRKQAIIDLKRAGLFEGPLKFRVLELDAAAKGEA